MPRLPMKGKDGSSTATAVWNRTLEFRFSSSADNEDTLEGLGRPDLTRLIAFRANSRSSGDEKISNVSFPSNGRVTSM